MAKNNVVAKLMAIDKAMTSHILAADATMTKDYRETLAVILAEHNAENVTTETMLQIVLTEAEIYLKYSEAIRKAAVAAMEDACLVLGGMTRQSLTEPKKLNKEYQKAKAAKKGA